MSAAKVKLRAVDSSDSPFLFRVYASSRAPELAAVPWDNTQKEDFLRFQFEAQQQYYAAEFPSAEHSIIEVEGEPLGRLYVDRREDEIRILDLAILEEYRGRGVGTELLRGLMSEGTTTLRPVSIHVEHYQPSISLFERLGFVNREDHGVSYLMEWRPEER